MPTSYHLEGLLEKPHTMNLIIHARGETEEFTDVVSCHVTPRGDLSWDRVEDNLLVQSCIRREEWVYYETKKKLPEKTEGEA